MVISTIGIKYPKLRDHPLHSTDQWLEDRRADDGAENLWRIHDNLYDLKDFINRHPGGKYWLKVTKGIDITEAFESHHIKSDKFTKLLENFFIRKAKQPRSYPFTFKPDGFYITLKKNVAEELKKIPDYPKIRSKIFADLLVTGYITFALIAAYFGSYTLALLSGIFLCFTANAAHNFFHQKDNFRMYYFDLTLMKSMDWRISHALSHHLYTNSIQDMEIASLEPFLQYLPVEKNIFFKYISWLYSPIFYSMIFFGSFVRNVCEMVLNRQISLLFFPRLSILVFMIFLAKTPVLGLVMFLFIQTVASLQFGFVGLNAAHHHPDIFHDGDTPRPADEMDWGIYQLDAIMDRKDITGSPFLVLTNFGDHALHHLFPCLDHGILEYLYPVFLDTCKQFGVEWRLISGLQLIKGQFGQLAKVKGNKVRPRPLIKELSK